MVWETCSSLLRLINGCKRPNLSIYWIGSYEKAQYIIERVAYRCLIKVFQGGESESVVCLRIFWSEDAKNLRKRKCVCQLQRTIGVYALNTIVKYI